MELSKFDPQAPPKHIKHIMNDVIIMQKYRDFKYERPILNRADTVQKPDTTYEYSEKTVDPRIPAQLKTKIIRKIRSQQMDTEREKKAQKAYNMYLLHYLNNSAMDSVRKRQPLDMSVLESREEGDYLPDGDRKDHPHFSNTIKLTQIPHENSSGFLPEVRRKPKLDFEQDDNCVLKIKQFRRFITLLFRMGNQEFEGIAEKIGLSTSTTKLLYDLSNDYFRVETSLDIKSHDIKKKVCKKILNFASTAFQKHKNRQGIQSSYVPFEQEFLSLACLQSVLDCEYIDDFCQHLCDLDALPIETNFKALRLENLEQVFEDWLNCLEQNCHTPLEHNITVRFRNLLFKQIMLEEKQTIDDYFQTLSDKNRLKGFDLYQLLQTLLESYCLYEFNADNVSFFQKINSFQNFMGVVDEFIANERRVVMKDKSNPEDYKYIRRFEFQQLLEFWEYQNEELTLLHDPRKNHTDFGVQTIIVNCKDTQTQVSKIHEEFSYLGFINNAIHEVNKLIEVQNTPEVLYSLNRVFDVLRKQKVVAVTVSIETLPSHSEQDQNYTYTTIHNKSKSPLRPSARSRSPIQPPKNKSEAQIKKIFQFLLKQNGNKKLTVSELQLFFYQIRLVKAHENFLIRNLLDSHFIEDPDDVTFQQFRSVISQLSKQSDKLSHISLKEYIENFIGEEEKRNYAMERMDNRRKVPQTERKQYLGLLENRNTALLSRSTFQLDSEQY